MRREKKKQKQFLSQMQMSLRQNLGILQSSNGLSQIDVLKIYLSFSATTKV